MSDELNLILPDLATELQSVGTQRLVVARRLTAVSLSLLLIGAIAATIPIELDHKSVKLTLGPLLSGLCFLVTLFISLALAEDRPEHNADVIAKIGLQLKTLAWKYAVGGYPLVQSYADSAAQRLYIDAVLDLTEPLGKAVSGTRIRMDGAYLTESMQRLRASSLEDRREAYRRLRLGIIADDAASRSANLTRRLRATRASARMFSVVALIVALAQAVDIIKIDFVGAATVGSTVVLAWGAMRKYDVDVGDAIIRYERARLFSMRVDTVDDESQWAGFVANCEEALWLATVGNFASALSHQI